MSISDGVKDVVQEDQIGCFNVTIVFVEEKVICIERLRSFKLDIVTIGDVYLVQKETIELSVERTITTVVMNDKVVLSIFGSTSGKVIHIAIRIG